MLNSTTFVPANLYNNLAPMIGGGAAAVTESPVPYCNSQVGDVVFQHLAKSMNCYSFNNPPLKDDSGLSFNYNALPLPRKRPRLADIEDGSVSILNDEMYIQMMQQQLEIDRLISIHMEKVRQEMEDRRRKQSNRVIQSIQEAVSRKLKEKEDEIEKIGKLNWALENRIKSLCVENQIWRDLAQTNEATANALRLNLEQVILSQSNNNNATVDPATEDAESCCGSSGNGREEDDDGGGVLRWRKVQGERKRICKRCGESESNVLVLPCRHLCLCAACGPAVETCPICNSAKTASVHVNLC